MSDRYDNIDIDDNDRDSLNILPLAIIPLETRGLRKSRMIKNTRLQTVIEIFNDDSSGSLQLEIEGVPSHFSWADAQPRPDMRILKKLKKLSSFDIYSLRMQLRSLDIEISNSEHLKLSTTKTQELTEYMTEFTRPLIQNIYGDNDNAVQSYADMVALFRSPDAAQALTKLNQMAQKLEIDLEELPRFLEDCGDTFLSLAYYRQCFDQVVPIAKQLIASMGEMRESFQLKTDRTLMEACDMIEARLNWVMKTLEKLFGMFDHRLGDVWNDLNAERFRDMKGAIEHHHTTVGGLLCALNVKMRAWSREFPDPEVGGLIRRGEFLLTEIKQGMESIGPAQNQPQEAVPPAA